MAYGNAETIVEGDAVTVTVGGVTFAYNGIVMRSGKFESDLAVTRPIPDDPLERVDFNPDLPPFQAHISAKSLSNVDAYRRALENYYGKDLEWSKLLMLACRMAEEAYKATAVSEDVDSYSLPPERSELVSGVLPERQLSCFFGLGEAAKSMTALSLAMAVGAEMFWLGRRTAYARTLWLDAENPEIEEFARRKQRLTMGTEYGEAAASGSIRWMGTRGVPLVDLLPAVEREVRRFMPRLIVVDSAGFVCGGNPIDPDIATRTCNALLSLKTTCLLLAHSTKAEDDRMPFGSAFWHYAIHGKSWFLKGVKGEEDVTVGFYLRKSSDGVRPKDFAVKFEFDGDGGPISMRPADIGDVSRETGRMTDTEKLLAVLTDGAMTTKAIADETGLDASTVRVRLNQMKGRKTVRLEDGRWGLLKA